MRCPDTTIYDCLPNELYSKVYNKKKGVVLAVWCIYQRSIMHFKRRKLTPVIK